MEENLKMIENYMERLRTPDNWVSLVVRTGHRHPFYGFVQVTDMLALDSTEFVGIGGESVTAVLREMANLIKIAY